MKLLGLDLETGAAFDEPVEKNWITEFGAVMWDTDLGQPVKIYNSLVQPPEGKEVHQEPADYTKITDAMVREHGAPRTEVFLVAEAMILEADYVVAQNGLLFDKVILREELPRQAVNFPEKHWIDTTIDVPYPKECRYQNLTYLAGFHGFVNPFPHRAVTDVLTMMKVLMQYDLGPIIESAESPVVKVIADVSFQQKDKAKAASFYFDGDRKVWFKSMRENKIAVLSPTWDFKFKTEKL